MIPLQIQDFCVSQPVLSVNHAYVYNRVVHFVEQYCERFVPSQFLYASR